MIGVKTGSIKREYNPLDCIDFINKINFWKNRFYFRENSLGFYQETIPLLMETPASEQPRQKPE